MATFTPVLPGINAPRLAVPVGCGCCPCRCGVCSADRGTTQLPCGLCVRFSFTGSTSFVPCNPLGVWIPVTARLTGQSRTLWESAWIPWAGGFSYKGLISCEWILGIAPGSGDSAHPAFFPYNFGLAPGCFTFMYAVRCDADDKIAMFMTADICASSITTYDCGPPLVVFSETNPASSGYGRSGDGSHTSCGSFQSAGGPCVSGVSIPLLSTIEIAEECPAAMMGAPAPPPRVGGSLPLCAHLDDERPLGGRERRDRRLDHGREWYPCKIGLGVDGVTTCCLEAPRGCKGCPGYQARPPQG